MELLPVGKVAGGVGCDYDSFRFGGDLIEGVDALSLELGDSLGPGGNGDGIDAFNLGEAVVVAGADASGSEYGDSDCHV